MNNDAVRIIRQDRAGDAFDKASVERFVAKDALKGTNYFSRRVRYMTADMRQAQALMDEANAMFGRSVEQVIETETRLAATVKKAGGTVRAAQNEMADTLARLMKTADVERVERYAAAMERLAGAMSTLSQLERDGRLAGIAHALGQHVQD